MTGEACYISQCWEKGNDWGGMVHKSVLGEGE